MEFLAHLLLITGFAGILHSYVTYPLFWQVFRRSRPAQTMGNARGATLKKVSLIVAAHNEESHIERRVKNLLGCDYPRDLMEIIIASDGSTDRTASLVRGLTSASTSLRLLDYPVRRGKVSVLNDACQEATGDVLVFSDANVDFHPQAIRELLHALDAPMVGCVCGRLIFRVKKGAAHEESEGLYWALETWLKRHEGAAGCLLGANGAIYAMPRQLWESCPPDTIIDDFFIPMRLMMKGWKTVYAPAAIAEEDLPPKAADEFGRRIRIGAGNFQALTRCLPMLNPSMGLAAWAFFSHKVLRWLGPFFMIFIAAGTLLWLLVGSPMALPLLCGQAVFYAAAWAGWRWPTISGPVRKITGTAHHFTAMNIALLLGFFRWLKGSQNAAWNRTQRN
jgi:cellulose synthase/poly-beta-1,6-N-acetylglucosamine synthase-like glycosyltransferase